MYFSLPKAVFFKYTLYFGLTLTIYVFEKYTSGFIEQVLLTLVLVIDFLNYYFFFWWWENFQIKIF